MISNCKIKTNVNIIILEGVTINLDALSPGFVVWESLTMFLLCLLQRTLMLKMELRVTMKKPFCFVPRV